MLQTGNFHKTGAVEPSQAPASSGALSSPRQSSAYLQAMRDLSLLLSTGGKKAAPVEGAPLRGEGTGEASRAALPVGNTGTTSKRVTHVGVVK